VSTRFQFDLLRPGRVAYTWKDWFLGAEGPRRLVGAAIASGALLAAVLLAGVLPAYWRLSGDLGVLPQLRRDVATSQNDLNLLRANLQALSREARRHVRWGDVLTTFSNQTPPALRIHKVEAVRGPPPGPGQPSAAGAGSLRIEALTPVRPGSPPLLDAAQFMAGLMRDPAMNRRYELRSWEIQPSTTTPGGPDGGAPHYLLIRVILAERSL
jgi:hypothetical protein